VCVEPTKENFHCYTKDVDIKNLQSFTKSGTPVVGTTELIRLPLFASSVIIPTSRIVTDILIT